MQIDTGDVSLVGDLQIAPTAIGLVILASGSGSGRRSSRNVAVAGALNAAGLSTLRFDLLTPEEGVADERRGGVLFDLPLLASRPIAAVDWALAGDGVGHLLIG